MEQLDGTLRSLIGGRRVRARVQHPQVKTRKERPGSPWVFRYWVDVLLPDGSLKPLRKYQEVGPSKGPNALTKKQAEIERDKLLANLNAPSVEIAIEQIASGGAVLFRDVACMYEQGYLSRKQIATPTRVKDEFYLRRYIVPQWGAYRLNQIQPKAVEDWLHATFKSWWTMHGARSIMGRVYKYAEGHGLWEEGQAQSGKQGKVGPKQHRYERRILTFDETARVLGRLEEPYALIIETCIATAARISEVLGLQWRHIDLETGTIKIAQRVWHQELGRPKSEDSCRVLGIGDLVERFRALGPTEPDAFVFQQKRAPGKPLWDSGVRDALHQAAQAEGCDFAGLGPHSFRRANITWRQEVGGSAIEASKIAGHRDLDTTGDYTFVTPERQNELTRRIQNRLVRALQAATIRHP